MDTSTRQRAAQDQADLLDLLLFAPDEGRIWLEDSRMMMIDVASFATLRGELVRTLGREAARRVILRAGFEAGRRNAELMRQRWRADFQKRAGNLGPRFHGLTGLLKAEAVRVNADRKAGRFEAEYIWHHSVEDDAHLMSFGVDNEPACWMEAGYASGWVTHEFGVPTLFREITCRSTGSNVCRVLARRAVDWGDESRDDLLCLGLIDDDGNLRPPEPTVLPELPAVDEMHDPDAIIGKSPALKASLHLLSRVAPTSACVLITGESGAGKELFARAVHKGSPRASGPFVAVNCAALPDTLLEAELFGVERGAYTGAAQSRPGRFERASGGTLFLDEIGSLSAVSQAKLLRALQEGEIERVGGTRAINVDVRIVAATNENLRKAVDKGTFREDLYYRLNVFPITLPPLRERRDDIRLLIAHFLSIYNRQHGRSVKGLTHDALRALLHYDFPGNVRELQNMVERAVILVDGDYIDLHHLFGGSENLVSSLYSPGSSGRLEPRSNRIEPADSALLERLAERVLSNGGELKLPDVAAQLESMIIDRALALSSGNVAQAARMLGMPRHRVEYRLRRATTTKQKIQTADDPRPGAGQP